MVWAYAGAKAKATRPLHEIYRYTPVSVERLLHGQWAPAEASDSPMLLASGDIRAKLASGSIVKLDFDSWESELVPEPVGFRQTVAWATVGDFEHFEAHAEMRGVALFSCIGFRAGSEQWWWTDVSRGASLGKKSGVVWRENRSSVFESQVASLRALREAQDEFLSGASGLVSSAFEVAGDQAHEDICGLLHHGVCGALAARLESEKQARRAEEEKLRAAEEKLRGPTEGMSNEEFAKALALRRKVRVLKEVLR